MQDLIKKINYKIVLRVLRICTIIVSVPFIAYIFNLCLMMVYNLGRYNGTFLRNLYNFVSWFNY